VRFTQEAGALLVRSAEVATELEQQPGEPLAHGAEDEVLDAHLQLLETGADLERHAARERLDLRDETLELDARDAPHHRRAHDLGVALALEVVDGRELAEDLSVAHEADRGVLPVLREPVDAHQAVLEQVDRLGHRIGREHDLALRVGADGGGGAELAALGRGESLEAVALVKVPDGVHAHRASRPLREPGSQPAPLDLSPRLHQPPPPHLRVSAPGLAHPRG
jgi:hypothetical protein